MTPRQIEGLVGTRAVAVAAGAHHCFAVAVDGCLFGWGVGKTEDERGRGTPVSTLGLCLQSNQCEPKQYPGLRVCRTELPRGGAARAPSVMHDGDR